jgi:hypothetical protein
LKQCTIAKNQFAGEEYFKWIIKHRLLIKNSVKLNSEQQLNGASPLKSNQGTKAGQQKTK